MLRRRERAAARSAADYLYYTVSGLMYPGTQRLYRKPLSGGAPASVLNGVTDVRRNAQQGGAHMLGTTATGLVRIAQPDDASPGTSTHPLAGLRQALALQPVIIGPDRSTSTRRLGRRRYELTDHLGNVRVVLGDRKLSDFDPQNTPIPTHFSAEVMAYADYDPFGSLLPGRHAPGDQAGYRFGFQGQEKDDEVFDAVGTLYAYEYRMHDARIGRFMSIDPLAFAFPWNSPYAFSENRVIDMVELEGLEAAETPDKAEDPKWGLPGGGEGWTEGDSYTAESGDSFKSFKGPKPNSGPSLMPNGGSTPKSSKGFNGPSLAESQPRIGSIPRSSGSSNFGLGYTVPSAGIADDNSYGIGAYLGVAGLMLDGTERALKSSAANTQFRYGTSKSTGRLTSVSNSTLTRATKIQLTSAANIASKIGTGIGVLGVGSTILETVADGNYTLGDFSRTLYSGASIAFPVLGLIDLGVQFGTGRSGSEWMGRGIDSLTGGWGLSW